MPSQFLDLDEPEAPLSAPDGRPLTIAELREAAELCPKGDTATKARYFDMLARASGLYAPEQDRQDERTALPDIAVATQLADWLTPSILGLLAGGNRPTEADVRAAVLGALAP